MQHLNIDVVASPQSWPLHMWVAIIVIMICLELLVSDRVFVFQWGKYFLQWFSLLQSEGCSGVVARCEEEVTAVAGQHSWAAEVAEEGSGRAISEGKTGEGLNCFSQRWAVRIQLLKDADHSRWVHLYRTVTHTKINRRPDVCNALRSIAHITHVYHTQHDTCLIH